MKASLVLILMLLAFSVATAGWQDDLTPATPGSFPQLRALKATYAFGWGTFTAADSDFDYSQEHKGIMRLRVNAHTVGAVRAMWRMDAQHTAFCDAATLRPINLQQTVAYRKEAEKVTADFSPKGVVRVQRSTPPGANPPKPKKFKCPDLFDLQTALLFVRSLPLKTGDEYSFVVYPATAPYLVRITVLAPEPLKVAGRTYETLKLNIGLQRVTKELTLESHQKFKQAVGWISNDDDRLLLKVKAEIFVGSVWAEMKKVEFREES